MNKIKKLNILFIIACLVLLCSCNKKTENYNNSLTLNNKSDEEIKNVVILEEKEKNLSADKIEVNSSKKFEISVQGQYAFSIEFEDTSGVKTLSNELSVNVNENDNVVVDIFKRDNGDWDFKVTKEE